MHELHEVLEISGANPVEGEVYVDEFVIRGKEIERQGTSNAGKKK